MKNKFWPDLKIILGLVIFLPLFLYNLGNYSLADFDEGWYAEVARNILVSHNPILLSFNGMPYLDHPALGFNLMALSFAIFGINEFAARFPSAILGFGSLVVLYLLGKNLFQSRAIGLGASLILVSCVWFIYRTRSGNLDSPLLFFYILTFYFAVKTKDNPDWLFALILSLSATLLTKSVIGVTVLVPVALFFLLEKIHLPWRKIFLASLLLLVTFLPWYFYNYLIFGRLFVDSNLSLGLRSGSRVTPNLAHLWSLPTIQYLHAGMGKWFYLGLFSSLLSLVMVRREKRVIPLIGAVAVLLFGFLTNAKTEIWHLLPLYPFLALVTSFVFFRLVKFAPIIPLIFFTVLSFFQVYQFRNGINLFTTQISGLAHTAKAAQQRPEPLFLDDTDFFPSVVYYSQKHVGFVPGFSHPWNILPGMISYGPKPFLLITQQKRLDDWKISPQSYAVIDRYDNYVLVRI